ncbi:hypothetical protein AVT69_gp206 [Pseudomonas phage PhiPA3]|uniref:Uncharacterized protein 208 n=1 Tax=Pseudomonas phage PhiPA3 TaxID=998086 RepID=F8SJ51_BPPA3|nr:hypothetical protein AVT69_gp206 [Pseudomonas phage PhiPA3]AEH03631.1 hypothetical protein [Pseudomonas phage PhiPA3]
MSEITSMDAVRDAAQSFTRDGRVLTVPNMDTPVGVFADGLNVDEQPNKVEMSDELAASVEDHFEEINQETPASVDDEREAMIANLHTAIARVQFNTQNVIIPAITAMHNDYASRQGASSQADCRVESFNYDPIHNDPRLVNHINDRYARVRPLAEYRTFMLKPLSAETIIEMVAVNNPHLDQEQVTEWALKIPVERIEAVWTALFGTGHVVNPASLDFLRLANAPFNIDELLMAYFICGHYIENPQTVPGESVTLDEWNNVVRLLHEMLGSYVLRAYARRIEAREREQLVLRYDADKYIENRKVVVIINGDVAPQWLAKGGNIQAILGAAIEGTGLDTVASIEAKSDYLVNRWVATYPLIKQAAIDAAERSRRQDIVAAFMSQVNETALKDRAIPNLRGVLADAMRYIRIEDTKNPYTVFATLICKVYFPQSTYLDYLQAIDEYGQHFPDASVRELNTQGLISLVALFLAAQIKVEDFEADVDPNAKLPEAEAESETGAEPLFQEEAEGKAEVDEDVVESVPESDDGLPPMAEGEDEFDEVEETEADPYDSVAEAGALTEEEAAETEEESVVDEAEVEAEEQAEEEQEEEEAPLA